MPSNSKNHSPLKKLINEKNNLKANPNSKLPTSTRLDSIIQDKLPTMIKKILLDTQMLEETLHEKQIENDTSCSCKDESTINNLTSKLTSAILGNDEFHKAIQNIVTTNLNSMLSEQLTEMKK